MAEQAKATHDIATIKGLLKELKETKKPMAKARITQFKNADWMFSAYKQKMGIPDVSIVLSKFIGSRSKTISISIAKYQTGHRDITPTHGQSYSNLRQSSGRQSRRLT